MQRANWDSHIQGGRIHFRASRQRALITTISLGFFQWTLKINAAAALIEPTHSLPGPGLHTQRNMKVSDIGKLGTDSVFTN